MQKIVDGKLYDTDVAKHLLNVSEGGRTPDDFEYDNTSLYRTAKGAFFLAGEGGARSRWGQRSGTRLNSGEGITVISEQDARDLIETLGPVSLYCEIFGDPEPG